MYHLDFRARDSGGPVMPGRLLAGSEDDLRREQRVVFLVHGFNVPRARGLAALTNLATQLTRATDAAHAAVTWPGDSWAGPVGYSFEGNDADDTARELVRFIDRVIPAGTPLAFASHSLGGRVVLETVKHLPRSRYAVTQVCVMAAAIDDFSVAWPRAYRAAVERSTRVAVLASEKDKVLRLAYPAGDILQSFLFFWKDVRGRALGLRGPRGRDGLAVPANVLHRQIPNGARVDHGDYIAVKPGDKHKAAGRFVDAVLAGDAAPDY